MNERTFQYVPHDAVAELEEEGWIRHPALDDTHHGQWSALMEAPPRRMIYLRGDPRNGVVELCIAPGDHTCQIERLTRRELKRLAMEAIDMFWKWPEE